MHANPPQTHMRILTLRPGFTGSRTSAEREEPPAGKAPTRMRPPSPKKATDSTQSDRAVSGRFIGTERIDPDRVRGVSSSTSIWRAAEYGDVDRLKMILDNGCDVNALCNDPGWRKKSPLSAAVDGNEPLAVRFLLQRGANPNLQDGDGDRYPLHWASAFGDYTECCELLLQARADLSVRDARGSTPIEFAKGASSYFFATPQRPGVLALLEQAAAAETSLPEGELPVWTADHAARCLAPKFWKAAQAGDVDELEKSAACHAALPPPRCYIPAHAHLHILTYLSALMPRRAVPRRCLEAGQPIDQWRPSKQHRMTALGAAILHGQYHAAALLIARRADVNRACAGSGLTPLHLASRHADRKECVELLLQAGADALAKTKQGATPLQLARQHEVCVAQ